MPQLDTFRHHYTISYATTYRVYEKEASKHSGSRWKLRRGKVTPQLQVTKKLCQKSLSALFSSPILPPITETHLVASTLSPTSREYRQEGVVSDRHSSRGDSSDIVLGMMGSIVVKRYLGIPCSYQKIDCMIAREEIDINE